MRVSRFVGAVLALLVMAPSLAFAQASIAGVVKDASGAVLPGVTVEAASPALIEKVRSVVSDGAGLFSIENLRPGSYSVTFTLPGFNTVKRDGIELSGSANVTVNADLRVGAVEETITVTGEAPLVDVKSTTTQRVMNQEVLQSTPTGRLYSDLGALVPGIKLSSGGVGQTQNVGGALGDTQSNMMIHGSKSVDMRVMQNGLPTSTLQAGGGLSISTPNVGAAQEVTLDTAGVSAELPTGGPRINFIPRDGGNQFKGSIFSSFANESMQADNFTQRLKDRGLRSVDAIKRNADFNPGIGGPFKQDSLWFYLTARALWADVYPGGILPNLNANNRNAWTYVPDTSGAKAVNNALWTDVQLRTTWQASARNKFAGSWEQQTRCSCPYFALATRSPEAGQDRVSPTQRILTAEWFSPVTSRLLIEAAALHRTEWWANAPPKGFASGEPGGMVGVLEQSTGLQYRGGGTASGTYLENWVPNYAMRAAVSYITGSHSFKVGFNEIFGYLENKTYTPAEPLFFRFNNGVPNQLTQFATPYFALSDEDSDFGVFAQDKWTLGRWTLTGGVRFDMFKSSFPEQSIGPAILAPTRQITFPKTANLDWKDVTPRMGAVYDVFGDGRTAVRTSLNKYLNGQTLNALGSAPNPILSLVNSAARSWNDANGNFKPDCDLTSVLANGECGSITANFGKSVPGATYDKELLTGWGNRNYNWEFAAGIQHQLLPRLALDVAYYRRWFGNFQATDNLALAPSDFDTYSIVAPRDPRLPNGGGYTVSGLRDVSAAKA
ncbi:MAG: carboxypeptidase regulatory-like domain-containing protein [Vicinamibacterales bacterium]